MVKFSVYLNRRVFVIYFYSSIVNADRHAVSSKAGEAFYGAFDAFRKDWKDAFILVCTFYD